MDKRVIGKLSHLPKHPLIPWFDRSAEKAGERYPGYTVYVFRRSEKRGDLIFIDPNKKETLPTVLQP